MRTEIENEAFRKNMRIFEVRKYEKNENRNIKLVF